MVLEFPSYEAALACYRSPEYQAAAALRKGKAELDLFVIEATTARSDGERPLGTRFPRARLRAHRLGLMPEFGQWRFISKAGSDCEGEREGGRARAFRALWRSNSPTTPRPPLANARGRRGDGQASRLI